MATQVVELTGDEAALLRSLDSVIRKQVEYERKLRDSAEAGDAAGVALEGALAKVQKESDTALRGLLKDLKVIGPEGAAAATAMKSHFEATGKAGFRSIDAILAQIRAIDPAAATAAEQAAEALRSAATSTNDDWETQIALLRQLGSVGQEAAKRIEDEMRSAAANAETGISGILDELQRINPAAASAAAAVRRDLGEAAKYSEGQFRDVLDELRSMGPEGKRAADEIRQHLVEAGKVAEKSMADVIAKLDGIDPAVASAAKSIVTNMAEAKTGTAKFFDSMRDQALSYVASIGVVATAVGTVREAWQLVIQEQNRAQDSLEATQGSDRRLLQVSATSEEFYANRKMRDQLAAQFGVDREVVGNTLFSGISMGFKDLVPQIIEASQVLEPQAAQLVGGKIPTMFDKENINATEAISATMVAARVSEADFENLAPAIAKAAEGARQLGSSFADTTATVAILASDFQDVNVAGDRAKAFSSKAALDERLKGQDITAAVETVAFWNEEDRQKFLGDSQEVNAFFSAASQRIAQIRDLAKEIAADVQSNGGELKAKVAIASEDPELIAIRENQRSKIKAAVDEKNSIGIQSTEASSTVSKVTSLLADEPAAARLIGRAYAETIGRALVGMGEMQSDDVAAATSTVARFAGRLAMGQVLPKQIANEIGKDDFTEVRNRSLKPDNIEQSAEAVNLLRQLATTNKQLLELEQAKRRAESREKPQTQPSVTPALSTMQP